MFSKAVTRGTTVARTLPRRQAYGITRRSVTTDAASSHAEKADVPTVSIGRRSIACWSRVEWATADDRT